MERLAPLFPESLNNEGWIYVDCFRPESRQFVSGAMEAHPISTLADGIGSAGKEVRIYADEMYSFSNLLQRVKESLLQAKRTQSGDVFIYEKSLFLDVLGVCTRVLEPITRIQQRLTPLLGRFSEGIKLKNFALRIQWMFITKVANDKGTFSQNV
jgi:hypothetical protein